MKRWCRQQNWRIYKMQKVLNKRILRDLKENFLRYFALFLLIAMGMYMVISVVGGAQSVIDGVEDAAEKNHVEDGEFTVFVPLEDKNVTELNKKGITLEKNFYMDYVLNDNSTVRIYKNRGKINMIDLDSGSLACKDDEIVLEKHYAQKHDLKAGSLITIGGNSFKVTGIGSVPDYDAVHENMSDSIVQSSKFGLGFVAQECYEKLKSEGKYSKTEEYVYSYLLNGKMTSGELKDYLCSLKLDRSKVKDKYFLKMLSKSEKTKTDIQNGVDKLSEGTKKLNGGLNNLKGHNKEIMDGVDKVYNGLLDDVSEKIASYGIHVKLTQSNYKTVLDGLMKQANKADPSLSMGLNAVKEQLDSYAKFKDGMKYYTGGESDAADGSLKLLDGINNLQKNTDDIMDKYFTVHIDNLTQFVKKKDNPNILASVDDVKINKSAGIVSGVIIMILFTYVISVFVIHGIEEESSVIGTLYALGVTKKQLISHYLMLPIIITLLGGGAGAAAGFSPYGAGIQAMDSINYYSFPVIKTVHPALLIIYGIIMPPLVAAFVNYLVINKKLSQPALKMIRNEQKQSKVSNISLGKLKFVQRFQIRQFLREMRANFTIVFGMFISLLILMIGLDCYTACTYINVHNKKDTTYGYMYLYKYPSKEVPKGGKACYMESLKKKIFGYDIDVNLLGIDKHNKYFNFTVNKGKNKVAISQAVAKKYGLSVGENLILCDEVNNVNYAFDIDKVVPYSVGLYAFMDIDSMRELFGKSNDYYNVVLSDSALDIEPERLYGTTTKDDICKSADVFIDNMRPMVVCMIAVSVIIFAVVMYLMMKVVIDRSAFNISLMKIFGFNNKEVRRLYLDGNFVLVAAADAVCVPLAKKIMDLIYPYFVSNVACGMNLKFTWQMYAGIYAGVLACYIVINKLLTGSIKRIKPAEVLKNRE